MTKIGYKVVALEETSLPYFFRSAFYHDEATVCYDLDHKSYRRLNCGGLALFDTLKHANMYYEGIRWNTIALLKCEYKPETNDVAGKCVYHIRNSYNDTFYVEFCGIEEFPRDKIKNTTRFSHTGIDTFPIGTVLARWVKPVEIIKVGY